MSSQESHPKFYKAKNATADFFTSTSNEKVNKVRSEVLKATFFVSSTIAAFETRDVLHPPDMIPISLSLGTVFLYGICHAAEKTDKKASLTPKVVEPNPEFSTNIIVNHIEDSYLGDLTEAEKALRVRLKDHHTTEHS